MTKWPSTPPYRPADDSPEMQYLQERRRELGGYLPQRRTDFKPLAVPQLDQFQDLLAGSGKREFSTTGGFGRVLSLLLRNKAIGKQIVPIIPDEARTFGMEAFFSQYGIYASTGQLYKPVDAGTMAYYREAKDGQILEEGINEAGAMSSFIAAGTAYATLGVTMSPFFIYYSMFGFQRVGDFIWCAADSRTKGFLLGATAGRTTLNGEGLQHEDGHSHLLAATVPNLLAYDPAYAYETAVIIQDWRRMYVVGESIFYYITLYNEDYAMPAMPAGAAEGILKGMYQGCVPRRRPMQRRKGRKLRVQLLGSGPILRLVLGVPRRCSRRTTRIASDAWSVHSVTEELRRELLEVGTLEHAAPHSDAPARVMCRKMLKDREGPFIAASDYMHLVPEQIGKWVPGGLVTLGTDGFGRSDSRLEGLRRHFEIDAAHIVFATLSTLFRQGKITRAAIQKAAKTLDIRGRRKDQLLFVRLTDKRTS